MEYCVPLPPWFGNTEPTFANTEETEVSLRPHPCLRSRAATNWRPGWPSVHTEAQPLDAVSAGRHIFESTSGINCHTISGTVAHGRFGPDLTHLMSRETLRAGAATNTHENLYAWIKDSNSIKPGSLMPAMKVNV